MSVSGARPHGAKDEWSAAEAVRLMFDRIAPRYDLLNHLLSANVDRLWWRRASRQFMHLLIEPNVTVLDICCGTGDMTLALLRHRPKNATPVLAADFSRAMLRRAVDKFAAQKAEATAVAVEADALHLPVQTGSLDLIVTAFGFRNLANYEAGLKEFHRALKPGGQLGILDFSEPDGLIGKAYAIYFRRVMPTVGRMVSGSGGEKAAYSYLPSSVENFPAPGEMVKLMQDTGYEQCAWQPYTFGIAGLYTGRRADVA